MMPARAFVLLSLRHDSAYALSLIARYVSYDARHAFSRRHARLPILPLRRRFISMPPVYFHIAAAERRLLFSIR